MRTMRRSFNVAGFLPEDIRAAIARRMREIGGVALIVLAAALAAALASWSVQDPSLSHATAAPVRNLLGVPGAIAADLLMQLIGVASLALIFPSPCGAGASLPIGRSTASACASSCGPPA